MFKTQNSSCGILMKNIHESIPSVSSFLELKTEFVFVNLYACGYTKFSI